MTLFPRTQLGCELKKKENGLVFCPRGSKNAGEVIQSCPLPANLGPVATWPAFIPACNGGLLTVNYKAVRHCLMLMKELEGTLLVSLEFNGFPAWQEAYSLTPSPFGGGGVRAEIDLGLLSCFRLPTLVPPPPSPSQYCRGPWSSLSGKN